MLKKILNFILESKYDILAGLIIVFLAIFAYIEKDKFDIFENREAFSAFIEGFGSWGPLIIVLVVILEVIIAPIPGFIIALTAGFLFGSVAGTVYVYIGNIIGTLLVFWIARRLGKPVLERFLKKDRVEKYEKIISKHENWLLFFYFFPILPIDIISAAFGLSNISLKKFLLVITLGFLVYSILTTNFGDFLAELYF